MEESGHAIKQWKANEGLIKGSDKIRFVIFEMWMVGSRGAQR